MSVMSIAPLRPQDHLAHRRKWRHTGGIEIRPDVPGIIRHVKEIRQAEQQARARS
jgi:hypothetical protein